MESFTTVVIVRQAVFKENEIMAAQSGSDFNGGDSGSIFSPQMLPMHKRRSAKRTQESSRGSQSSKRHSADTASR